MAIVFPCLQETIKSYKDSHASTSIDEDMTNQSQLSRLIEWVQISTVNYAEDGYELLLARLPRDIATRSPLSHGKVGAARFDTCAFLALLEFIYPVRLLVFFTSTNLLVPGCDTKTFASVMEKEGESTLNPIALVILVVTVDHVVIPVVNSGLITWVNCRDTLPEFVKASVARVEDIFQNSASDLVHNWDDGNNDILNFTLDSEMEMTVKLSHR